MGDPGSVQPWHNLIRCSMHRPLAYCHRNLLLPTSQAKKKKVVILAARMGNVWYFFLKLELGRNAYNIPFEIVFFLPRPELFQSMACGIMSVRAEPFLLF